MSCRVLERGMEEFIMNFIYDFATKNKYNLLNAEYLETKKNIIVKDLYKKLGFSSMKNKFQLNLKKNYNLKTHINLKDE